MKKITLLLLFLLTLCGYAQVSNYSFTKSMGTYTPIGTNVGTALTPSINPSTQDYLLTTRYYNDPVTKQGTASTTEGEGFPIGFDFVYDGTVYNQFGVCINGWISLGNTNFSPKVSLKAGPLTPLSQTFTGTPLSTEPRLISRISAVGSGLLFQAGSQPQQTSSDLRYVTQGTSPNRVLVVQWTDFKKGTNGTDDHYNFQIRLHEGTNKVEIIYGSIVNNPTNGANWQVGLRSAPASAATNYSNLTSTDWTLANITAGTAATAVIPVSSANVPASGLTFTWTPPTCGNPSQLVASNITTGGATLNWSALPAPTGYEYVVSPTSTAPTAGGTSTVNPTATVSGLAPNTLQYVYIRSNCGTWVLAGTFRTKCEDITAFAEDFESYNYQDKVMPMCWENPGTTGKAYVIWDQANASLTSGANRLYLKADGTIFKDANGNVKPITAPTFAYAVLPSVSNLQANTHRLRFKAYAATYDWSEKKTIDLGYFTNSNDVNTFVSLQKIELESAGGISVAPEFTIEPKGIPAGVKNLVFKTVTVVFQDPACTLETPPCALPDPLPRPGSIEAYIDNVIWESIPLCPNVSNVVAKGITHNSVNISWTKGGVESSWQYALGSSTVSDPSGLTAKDFVDAPTSNESVATGKIAAGLSPATSYKVWIRSNCHEDSQGAWIGPAVFTTACEPVAQFVEDFNTIDILPACWNKVGTTGTVLGTSVDGSVALALSSKSTNDYCIVSMKPVSNSAAGTQRLRFKLKGSVDGAKVDIGYLTDITDPNSFVYMQTFAANASFEEIITAFGSATKSAYLAFRNPGEQYSTIYIDDLNWETIPVCSDIKSLVVTSVTDKSIVLRWTAGDSENKWQYAIGNATDEVSTLITKDIINPSVIGSNIKATVNNLTASTSYKIWVRSNCVTSEGIWIGPITFTTTCAPVSEFAQNFDDSLNMPSCWTKVGTGVAEVKAMPYFPTDPKAPTAPNALRLNSDNAVPAIAVMQPVNNAGQGTHRLKFKFSGTVPDSNLEVGYLMNIADPNSFVPLATIPVTAVNTMVPKTINLSSDSATALLAFRNPGVELANVNIFIDDVVWEAIPDSPPSAATGQKAVVNPSCGNFATAISWNNVAGADGYKLTIGTAQGASDVFSDEDLGDVLTYSYAGEINTTYYYTVKPYNSIGDSMTNPEFHFTTSASGCYCPSVPISTDNKGITNIQIGGTNFPNTAKGYFNFTSKTVNLAVNQDANLKITFDTGLNPYNTNVWVDFNDNYNFEESEIVFFGATSVEMPSVQDASFLVKGGVKMGLHRMRISSSGAAQNNPCYSWIKGITLDFNVNIIESVVNDVPFGATELTTGNAFADYPVTGTNVNATGSANDTTPACGNYNGDDVWFTAIVPASGSVTFEINTAPNGITNTAAAIYSGNYQYLQFAGCDDSSSTSGDDQPRVVISGRTPGERLYLRVWSPGNNAAGPFLVSAYQTSLGVNDFDDINFSYYPNPVKDMLNLSFSEAMNNVSVMNLLRQEVMAKSLNTNQGTIDMSGLSKGAYLVKVTAGNQSKTIKVIKE